MGNFCVNMTRRTRVNVLRLILRNLVAIVITVVTFVPANGKKLAYTVHRNRLIIQMTREELAQFDFSLIAIAVETLTSWTIKSAMLNLLNNNTNNSREVDKFGSWLTDASSQLTELIVERETRTTLMKCSIGESRKRMLSNVDIVQTAKKF